MYCSPLRTRSPSSAKTRTCRSSDALARPAPPCARMQLVGPRSGDEPPLLRRWGERKRTRYRRPVLPWLLAAALVGLGVVVWRAVREHTWQPPSDAPRFAACSYGGYVAAW